MLDELGAAADAQVQAGEDALALGGHVRVFALALLHVHVEGVALEEQLQVAVVLQDRVRRRLGQHLLQRHAPRLDEVGVEAADRLFLRRRRHHGARVVAVQLVVEPEEVTIAAGDFKFGPAVRFRGCLVVRG